MLRYEQYSRTEEIKIHIVWVPGVHCFSLYSLCCNPLPHEEWNRNEVVGKAAARRGEGELTIANHNALMSRLSTTPSSMGFLKKSIVDSTVAPDYRKFAILEIAYCP